MGGIIWAVGDGRWNQSESMMVRDEEFFKSIQHSALHTVGPQKMIAVMISIWKGLKYLK